MTAQEFKDLLDKYLKGTASEEELNLIEAYEESVGSNAKDIAFESESDKQALNLEIKKNILKKMAPKKPKYPWLKIAASIAVITVTTIMAILLGSQSVVYENDTAQTMKVDLPDGSQVILNRNARLDYRKKSNNIRFAVLEGEAFFNVARDEHAPFVVQTNDIRTRVLGTSFNVRSTDSIIDVSVATGLVQVTSKEQSMKLRPNQKMTYQMYSRKMQKDSLDQVLFTAWYKSSIKLEGVRMIDLARVLESRYGLRIYFKDEMAKEQTMTISIRQDESLGDVVNNIQFISQLSLTKTKTNEITIQSKK